MPANGFSWMSSIRPCCGASRRIVLMTIMLWSDPTDVASYTGAISNWPGATSLWRVLAGMPRRHSSRSRSIMNARIRSRIGPKYWSSSSWPLGDAAPNRVRPVSSRSGRCSASRRSTRKYSCSGPMLVNTRLGRRVAEPAQHAQGLLAERLLRAEQRDLVVERLAGERDVRRRDGQGDAVGLDLQEDRRGDVPGGVAARLERGPDAARRERAGVRLALDEVLARELGDGRGRRRSGSGTSRASRRSSRSSARTSACSGSRRGPAPIPSPRARPRRRSAGSNGSWPSIVRRSFSKIGLARYWRWATSSKTYWP